MYADIDGVKCIIGLLSMAILKENFIQVFMFVGRPTWGDNRLNEHKASVYCNFQSHRGLFSYGFKNKNTHRLILPKKLCASLEESHLLISKTAENTEYTTNRKSRKIKNKKKKKKKTKKNENHSRIFILHM